jgi:hypothetical protein
MCKPFALYYEWVQQTSQVFETVETFRNCQVGVNRKPNDTQID